MDIPINAKVSCSDGLFGQSTHVILMPTTEKITHVVVVNEMYPEIEYLVSIDHIVESTQKLIQLNCTREEISKMPVFEKEHFIASNFAGEMSQSLLWPFSTPEASFIRVEEEHIPANELAIRRGANVEATDGHVGRVDEFLINPENEGITHLILREGHLWGHKDVSIPVGQIDHYQDNTVYLKMDKHRIEALPAIPIRRGSSDKNGS
jgi:sporulation protein YlmC with PRC-barrel domain